jgi:hypothetical protein
VNADAEQKSDAAAGDTHRDLSQRARAIGVVVWSSFLAACAGTMFFFAFIAPADIIGAAEGSGWQDHLGVYTLGFFGLWCLGAVASAIALYLHDVFHTPGSRS